MGKYIRKSKAVAEVTLMEISHSSLGVRTRAKTLALKQIQLSGTPDHSLENSSYLQLRSRRLLKPPLKPYNKNPNPNFMPNSDSRENSRVSGSCPSVRDFTKKSGSGENCSCDLGIQSSLGENVVEFHRRERSSRESTPCTLMKDSDAIRTPGSTTRPATSPVVSQRIENPARLDIPTEQDINDFFACSEQEQERLFIEKYNFDPVNEKPLPGNFRWERVGSM